MDAKAVFTPGPWRVGGDGPEYDVLAGDHGDSVVSRGYEGDGGVQSLADARLIAAAPDLYEALRDMVEGHMENETPGAGRAIFARELEILRKAVEGDAD